MFSQTLFLSLLSVILHTLTFSVLSNSKEHSYTYSLANSPFELVHFQVP